MRCIPGAIATRLVLVTVFTIGLDARSNGNELTPYNTDPRARLIGTWAGESVCVGNHPTCNTEQVVYRIEAVAAKPNSVLLLADKVINRKRVPMYSIEMQYDSKTGVLAGEFTSRATRGLWRNEVTSNEMDGTLVVLPDKELWREIRVRRVSADSVPPAPRRDEYSGV